MRTLGIYTPLDMCRVYPTIVHTIPREPTHGLRALSQWTLGVVPYVFYNRTYPSRETVKAPSTLIGLGHMVIYTILTHGATTLINRRVTDPSTMYSCASVHTAVQLGGVGALSVASFWASSRS